MDNPAARPTMPMLDKSAANGLAMIVMSAR